MINECGKLCSKNHHEDCVIGDIHTDYSDSGSLTTYIYNGTSWVEISPSVSTTITSASGSSITTSSSSSSTGGTYTTGTGGLYGAGGTGYTTTTVPYVYSPSDTTPTKNPFDEEFEKTDIPNRDVYVAREIFNHSKASVFSGPATCNCGVRYEGAGGYTIHIANVAIEAADKWDQLIMDGNDVSDDE
jgi:hypothetical protein